MRSLHSFHGLRNWYVFSFMFFEHSPPDHLNTKQGIGIREKVIWDKKVLLKREGKSDMDSY